MRQVEPETDVFISLNKGILACFIVTFMPQACLAVEREDVSLRDATVAQKAPHRPLFFLTRADRFADGIIGLTYPPNWKDPYFFAFETLVKNRKSISVTSLQSAMKRSTPAGKLYIAALLREIDPPVGKAALQSLLGDSTKVREREGCVVDYFSVGELAKFLLEDSTFERFRNSDRFLSLEQRDEKKRIEMTRNRLEALSQAKTFSDVPKPVANSRIQKAPVDLLLCYKGQASAKTLRDYIKEATPAGKLYMAALMQVFDPEEAEVTLGELTKDSSKVVYVSGSATAEYSVAEIAQQFLRNGYFQNFSLRR